MCGRKITEKQSNLGCYAGPRENVKSGVFDGPSMDCYLYTICKHNTQHEEAAVFGLSLTTTNRGRGGQSS